VTGNDEAAVAVVRVPGGFDRFFAACAEAFNRGEPEMPLLVKLAAELMSNSYAKRSITSFALTMRRRLPLNGAGVKSNNSLSEIISLISANNH